MKMERESAKSCGCDAGAWPAGHLCAIHYAEHMARPEPRPNPFATQTTRGASTRRKTEESTTPIIGTNGGWTSPNGPEVEYPFIPESKDIANGISGIPAKVPPKMFLLDAISAKGPKIGSLSSRPPILPDDAEMRKTVPVATGVLDYFPHALTAIAHVSYLGNEQHNPNQPLRWSREKSADHPDCLIRHFLQRGTLDIDGMRHSAKMAWRALAILELELESK